MSPLAFVSNIFSQKHVLFSIGFSDEAHGYIAQKRMKTSGETPHKKNGAEKICKKHGDKDGTFLRCRHAKHVHHSSMGKLNKAIKDVGTFGILFCCMYICADELSRTSYQNKSLQTLYIFFFVVARFYWFYSFAFVHARPTYDDRVVILY